MRARRLTPVLAAAVLAALAASGCAEQSAGARVGDHVVPESEVIDELEAYGDSQTVREAGGVEAAGLAGELQGSYSQQFVSYLLERRIALLIVDDVFEAEGMEMGGRAEVDAQQAVAQDQQLLAELNDLPEEFARPLFEGLTRRQMLIDELGAEEAASALREQADATEISVSSRFGRWDAEQYRVLPPDGPTAAGGDEGLTPVPLG